MDMPSKPLSEKDISAIQQHTNHNFNLEDPFHGKTTINDEWKPIHPRNNGAKQTPHHLYLKQFKHPLRPLQRPLQPQKIINKIMSKDRKKETNWASTSETQQPTLGRKQQPKYLSLLVTVYAEHNMQNTLRTVLSWH